MQNLDQLEKFKFTCFRKHFLVNKIYYGEVDQNEMNPKYVFKFDFGNQVYWKSDSNKLFAFGLLYNEKIKWFYSNEIELVRESLQKKAFFADILKQFEVIRIIGSGQAQVLGKQLCNKVYKQEIHLLEAKLDSISNILQQQKISQQHLIQEISILKEVNHQYLVKMIEMYEGKESFYIITDLYKGDTLLKYLRNNSKFIDDKSIKAIMKQILEALYYLNTLKIVHRNLKLENIVFEKPGDVNSLKIVDFGLSIHENIINYNQICGTPGFIAPEILKGSATPNHKNDIFSTGVIFYKLLFKKSLFPASETKELLRQNKLCQFHQFNTDSLSRSTKELLLLMLQENPIKRCTAEKQSVYYVKPQIQLLKFEQCMNSYYNQSQEFDSIEQEKDGAQVPKISETTPNNKNNPNQRRRTFNFEYFYDSPQHDKIGKSIAKFSQSYFPSFEQFQFPSNEEIYQERKENPTFSQFIKQQQNQVKPVIIFKDLKIQE